MAQSKSTIEDLPVDILKDIMIRVAANPINGAVDTYNTFFIKAFHDFSNDEDFLKTVIFKDLSTYCNINLGGPSSLCSQQESGFPDLSRQFEVFEKIGGYIYKAAKVDNHSAQILLAKLIMRSTSEVFRGRNEELMYDTPLEDEVNDKISKRAKAASFLAHFLPWPEADDEVNTTEYNSLMHYELVKTFLQQANLEDVQEMKPYLTDYVTCFYDPKVEAHCSKVLELLQELNSIRTIVVNERIIAQIYIKSLNSMSVRVCKDMRCLGMNIEVVEALEKWLVMDNCLTPNELMNLLTGLETFLKDNIKNEHGDGALFMAKLAEKIFVLKETLSMHLHLIKFVADNLAHLVSEFDAIFSV